MSEHVDESDQAPIQKLGKGRLKRKVSTDEEMQKDDISLSLSLIDVQIEQNIKPKTKKQLQKIKKNTQDKKSKKLGQNKKSDSENIISNDLISEELSMGSLMDVGENEIQKPKIKNKKQKATKFVPDNAEILKKYQNDPRFQSQEDDKSEKSNLSPQKELEFGGFEKKKNEKKVSKISNGINNKSKFFKNIHEDCIIEDVPIAEEQFVKDDKLIFEKKVFPELQKEDVKKKLFEVAQKYKEKVAVFDMKDKSSEQMATLGSSTILSRQLSNTEAPFQQFRRAQSTLEFDTNKDQPELEFVMPKVGTRNQVLDGTLYINKMINMQRGNSNLIKLPTQSIQLQSTKSLSRSSFIKSLHERTNENKKIHKLDDMMRIFQHTDFNQINQKQQQSKNLEQNKNDNNVQEENEEDTSDEEINSQDLVKEQEEAERGSDEEDNQELGSSEQEDEERSSENDEYSEQKNNESSDMILEGEGQKQTTIQEEQIIRPEEFELKPQAVKKIDTSDDSADEDLQIDQEEIKAFSKLRKISQIKKQKKIEQLKLQQRQKEKEQKKQEALKMREYIQKNFVEQEAELGSDNEDHDDVVKQVEDNDEEDEGDGYLVDLIDEQIADIDEENEERAYKLYLKKLRDQDKEDIRKILRGDFKGRHEKSEIDKEFLNSHNDELDRIKRMEECMRILQGKEENIDEDELADVEIGISDLMSKQELIQQYKQERAYQAHEKLKQQLKQMEKKNHSNIFQILNKDIMSKVIDKPQQKPKDIQKSLKSTLIFSSFRNSNSYLANNSNHNGFKKEQNLIDKNTNSNSVSLLTKQDNKKNQAIQNTSLNRLFASFQSSDQKNVPQLKNKSPRKVFLFQKK